MRTKALNQMQIDPFAMNQFYQNVFHFYLSKLMLLPNKSIITQTKHKTTKPQIMYNINTTYK